MHIFRIILFISLFTSSPILADNTPDEDFLHQRTKRASSRTSSSATADLLDAYGLLDAHGLLDAYRFAGRLMTAGTVMLGFYWGYQYFSEGCWGPTCQGECPAFLNG